MQGFSDDPDRVVADTIALIEDWERKKLRESGTCRGEGMALCECCYDARELDDKVRLLQAQVQAVREVCDKDSIIVRYVPNDGLRMVNVERVLRALEGERDE